ncbi:MAG: type 4a pilus biogenesis protein PilO [Sedimentisphaerales bacterium]|jgi:type IV pilus assembly protein PilO|nr:type 4a pilus biogenesis protein PilO [Sedimentisphaerales bacterium]
MSSGARHVLFFGLLMGLSIAGYQFMIRPSNAQLAAAKQRVEAKLAKLAEFEKATAKVQDINKQMAQIDQAIAFFESKLPPSSQIHKVLEQVTLIAQRHNLDPKTIRTLARKDSDAYVEQPLSLQLEGNFNAFYSFLLELERLPRIIRVSKMDLVKVKDQNAGIITADLVISIFFQPSKA